jgi:hypothetical protein
MLDNLPFLKSLCWQSDAPTTNQLSDAEILQLYERNWRYRGVITDLSEAEKVFVYELALKYHSWLVNEV